MRSARLITTAAIGTAALLAGAGIAAASPNVSATVLSDGSVVVSTTSCGTSGATASVMWGSNGGQSISKPMSQSSGPLVATFTGLSRGKYTVQVNCNNSPAPDPGATTVWVPGPNGGARTGDGASQTSTTDELALGSGLAGLGLVGGFVALRRRGAKTGV